MNIILERVNLVCGHVRERNTHGVSFKKLIGSLRSSFRAHDFNISIKTKKDKTLDPSEFYVNAYYDAEDDFNDEIPIEIISYHNFSDTALFNKTQITDFLIQIFDATVHEYRHQQQSKRRNYKVYGVHVIEPHEDYLTDSDELDAYALSIAIELLRSMSKDRAKMYMTRISILAKMRLGDNYVSTNLKDYIDHFGLTTLTKNLAKKVYKHLDALDKSHIFM